MPKYQDAYAKEDELKLNEAGDGSTGVFGRKIPAMYRTWVAIAAVALTLVAIIVIVVGSGEGRPEGGKVPRAVVIAVESFDPAALRMAMASNKAPALQALTSLGLFATCSEAEQSDGLCPSSGGLPELLAGRVGGNATAAPSFLQRARRAMLRPTVIAPEHLFSGTRFVAAEARCERVGALDAECLQDSCWDGMEESCNRAHRISYDNAMRETLFTSFVDAAKEYSELIYLHVDSLQAAAATADVEGNGNTGAPGATSTAAALRYLSSLYLVDALIGNIATVVRDRTAENVENWLVVVVGTETSSRSSSSSSSGGGGGGVPLFAAGFSSAMPISLRPLAAPVRTADIAPTVLQWLGIEETSVSAQSSFDGSVQGLCSSGVLPAKC